MDLSPLWNAEFQAQGRNWDPAAVNYVTVECWKAHRSKNAATDLSLLPHMNFDVLFEILAHLHPLDLVHLSRVSKAFRELLLSPSACPLWRSSFQSPLPLCPSVVSGRRWANLLFGPQYCDECATPNTFPDFILYRRLCTDCMGKRLFDGVPEYSPSHPVNELLPKSFRLEGNSRDSDSDVGRLSLRDGTVVAQEYERLKSAGDVSAFDAFVERRRKYVEDAEELANNARFWTEHILSRSQSVRNVQYYRAMKKARSCLRAEGHHRLDVAELDDLPELEGIQHLTPRRWNRVRPVILPLISDIRDERLKRERDELVASRTTAAASAIADVLRTQPPQTYSYFPPNYTIETFPPLHTLLQDPSDDQLSADDPRLPEALRGLPEFVHNWREEKRELLVSLLPEPSSPNAPTGIARLSLATSVYTCKGSWVNSTKVTAGRSLVGWEGAGAHLRCRSLKRFWDNRLHYAPECAATAHELVRLVGLDPDVTTAAEMDALCGNGSIHPGRPVYENEKRFVCAVCPVRSAKGIVGRPALRWRECVLHTIEQTRRQKDDAHATPSWMLLTDEATEDVCRREEPDPFIRDAAWLCTLCTHHYDHRETRLAVLQHLWNVHEIGIPVEGTHFVHYPGCQRTPRVPMMLSQVPPNADGSANITHANLRCNRCPKTGILKLWALRAIRLHLIDKHDVVTPSEEAGDWSEVELILRATPSVVNSGVA